MVPRRRHSDPDSLPSRYPTRARPDLRLTVDTEGDLAFMRHVLDAAGAREGVVPLPDVIEAADRVMAAAGVA